MKISIFGSLAPLARGRPRKEGGSGMLAAGGTLPWLPESAQHLVKRQAQLTKLRRSICALGPVQGLPQNRLDCLLMEVLKALDAWETSKDDLWCFYPVPGNGALGMAAQACGQGTYRPRRESLRGRKPKVADVRFLLACVDAWAAISGKQKLWRLRQRELMNRSKHTWGVRLRKPIAVQIAEAAWMSFGHRVSETSWPGLIDNAQRELQFRANKKS